ncbi:hypothetical protein HYH03_001872 [Edaphochlamys debaryana]|uniref:Methyltransferase n=1 Tax=Edaphochlamys debaryana TaxID=47281 RepID=A0A835YEI3_9CHLO|nr:hypothetical protein HYH03_001872 [Edaphochlamys debaryana]|eukprot:KAG2500294.1 hypothetical protein HYH03_001872 [Edaphochlamys debaryana]
MKDWDLCGRRYWGFDSFQGLPAPVDADKVGGMSVGEAGIMAAGQKDVEAHFAAANVTELVTLTAGWFNETLPGATVEHIAFLRLDGDLFVSTWDGLVNLYPKVVPGGLVYVDDYGAFNGCKLAVDLYRTQHGITAPLHWIREEDNHVEAVWWRKPLNPGPRGGRGHGGGGTT